MEVQGLHHITAITSDASTAVRFYTRVLGLRLVKKTVNFDDPTAYHLYFGDEKARPGTILTFFDWGNGIGHGRLGSGVAQHLAFTTRNNDSLSKWKTRLEQYAVPFLGPFDRRSFQSLYLQDPDGLILEIATQNTGRGYSDEDFPEARLSQWEPTTHRKALEKVDPFDPDAALLGLHHVTAVSHDPRPNQEFYVNVLRLNPVEHSPGTKHNMFGRGDGQPGSMISLLHVPGASHGTVGIGTVHHIAFIVEDEEEQLAWRKRLTAKGYQVTRVMDRKYFKSIYFRELSGVLLEIATRGPGFTIDEPPAHLGNTLTLPEWLEPQRNQIQSALKPINP